MTEHDPYVAPAHWDADIVAADGGVVHIRPIRPSDADALVAFHAGLSLRTRYLRFFSAYPRIPPRDLARFVTVDHHDRVALVAELAGQIIAVGRYERHAGTDEAEVAFVVADAHQGRGIGSVLLEHLAAAARETGIRRFQALVLAENTAMIGVFRQAGYEVTRHHEHGEVLLEFDVDETALTETVMHEREQRAEARSIARLLAPASVAVVGASNDEAKIGSAVFRNLLHMGLDGPLYPVNAEARHVHGVRAYASLLDVPDDVDVVVVAVPASGVPGVVDECAQRGVRGLVVLSGGFGERGTDDERAHGHQAQRELVAAARTHGMRVVGPNCLGIVNTDPAVRLNASLAPLAPLRGRAGFFCQSGALGVAVLGEAARRGIGVSTFVSAGNRADVSGNDLMQFWEGDPHTDVVLMYLESFGNPHKFARVSRRLARHKPIVAVKAGAGQVVAGLAHTSVSISETSVRALFERSGVIRVDTVGDLFDVALLLTSQPLPAGARVAVVGNSTALGMLVVNALAEAQLQLARLDDVGVEAGAPAFEAALREALADPAVDSVVVVFVPPVRRASSDDVAVTLRVVAADSAKPVVSTFLGFEGVPGGLAASGDTSPAPGSVPSYASPERAVRALARVSRYASWRRQPPGTIPELEGVGAGELEAARDLVRATLDATRGGATMTDDEAAAVLGSVGIDVVIRGSGADEIDVELAVHDDPSFGALISFGIGGVATELFDDHSYAIVPLTTADADDLLAAPRAAPLLDGRAGGVVASRAALRDLVLRLSALAEAVAELTAVELRVAAGRQRAVVVGARLRVAPPPAQLDAGPRRLRGL